MRKIMLAFFGAGALTAPIVTTATTAQAQGLFNCNKPGNSSGSGAVIGDLIGNGIAGDDRRDRIAGTVLGAGVGAAVGSSVGCNMAPADSTRAETATRTALNNNLSTTWSNSRSGYSGRIDIVNTFYRGGVASRVPDYNGPPRSLNDIRFARGVGMPGSYDLLQDRYVVGYGRANIYATPDPRSAILGQVREGEEFDGLARVSGRWLLAGQNGMAVGYIIESWADRQGRADLYAYSSRPPPQRVSERQVCRTFDQTVRRKGYRGETQRYTACQNAAGQWIIDG